MQINNQFSKLPDQQFPHRVGFFLRIKNWFLKNKKIILLIAAVAILAIAFVIYYAYWAKGYIYFSADPQKLTLTIEGKDYCFRNIHFALHGWLHLALNH
jgi:hypothetical protein